MEYLHQRNLDQLLKLQQHDVANAAPNTSQH
jgi:hypothetical protein